MAHIDAGPEEIPALLKIVIFIFLVLSVHTLR